MSKVKYKLILAFLVLSLNSYSQSVADTIKKLAIECNELTSPNEHLYKILKDYKFICIGEMHGTKEPAEFLTGLARTLVSHGRNVTVCFEILDNEMAAFKKTRTDSSLPKTKFFKNENGSGMNSEAWFTAISACSELGAAFCFFDGDSDEAMYDNILACYNSDSNSVFLTLSGNIHNKLVPYKGSKKMGTYLFEKFGNKVFSMNHIYNEGTMYNRTSEGLKVRTIEPINSAFATSTAFKNYFISNIFSSTDGYSAYLFTRQVTASLPKIKK